jgi:fumarate hydratase class II
MWTTLFAALSAHDGMVGVSGALRILAGALMKIGNDVRWFACDPRGGFGAAGGHILSTASVTMAITAQLVPRAKSPKQ